MGATPMPRKGDAAVDPAIAAEPKRLAADVERLAAEREPLGAERLRLNVDRDCPAFGLPRFAADRRRLAFGLERLEAERRAVAADGQRLAVGRATVSDRVSQVRRGSADEERSALRKRDGTGAIAMATSFFNSNNDWTLAIGSRAFARLIGEDPERYGLSVQLAADYAAVDAVWQAAYAASHPVTRTRSSTIAKNDARDVMRRAASLLAKRVTGTQGVSDEDRASLGLSLRARPTSVGPPGKPERFASKIDLRGTLTLTWHSANPRGSTGTVYQIYRRFGTAGERMYLGCVGERRYVDGAIPAGATSATYQVHAVRSTATGEIGEYTATFGAARNGIVAPDGTWLQRAA